MGDRVRTGPVRRDRLRYLLEMTNAINLDPTVFPRLCFPTVWCRFLVLFFLHGVGFCARAGHAAHGWVGLAGAGGSHLARPNGPLAGSSVSQRQGLQVTAQKIIQETKSIAYYCEIPQKYC